MNLKITKTKRKLLKATDLDHALGGSEATYIQLSRNIGVKLFTEQSIRDYSYGNHAYAYANGFGPNLGQKFYLQHKEGNFYCYVTQHALPAAEHKLRYHGEAKDALLKTMEDHGWSTCDYEDSCGDRNLGFIGDQMVCIDFGPMSQDTFI